MEKLFGFCIMPLEPSAILRDNFAALAQDAESRGAHEEAARQWQSAVDANSSGPFCSLRLIGALTKCGRHADAEAAATQASKRFPDNAAIALELGWTAARDNNWIVAASRWHEAALKFPENPMIANVLGTAYVQVGKLKEAEKVFTDAYYKFSRNFVLAMAFATLPAKEGSWAVSIERLEALVKNFPEQPNGAAQLANMLRIAGRKDEAAHLLSVSLEKFPDSAGIAIEVARLSEPDWPVATEKWRKVVEAFPFDPVGHAGFGRALRRAGEHVQSERVLKAARERFPRQFQIEFEYAGLANDKSDWEEAMRRWQMVVEHFPQNLVARNALAGVRWNASFSRLLDGSLADVGNADPAASSTSRDEGKIFRQFESLGEDCEFGLVQRHYGEEPLGLLRFAYVHWTSLLDLLERRLEGVGDLEHTKLDRMDNEYLVSDKRYGIASHTNVPPYSVDGEKFLKDQCRKLLFLKKRLLKSLESAEKIFVVTAHDVTADDYVLVLYNALRTYGPNRLLYVRANVPNKASGYIQRVDDGLIFGYLDRWSRDPKGIWNISKSMWLTLCEKTIDEFSRDFVAPDAS